MITQKKRKGILGSFFKTIEKDDADILKIVNKRIKLEKDRISKEEELRIQKETLEHEVRNTDNVEVPDLNKETPSIVENQNIPSNN